MIMIHADHTISLPKQSIVVEVTIRNQSQIFLVQFKKFHLQAISNRKW